MSDIFSYVRNNTIHVRDLHGGHWTVRQGRQTGNTTRETSDGSPIDPSSEIQKREAAYWLKDEHKKKKGGGGTYGRFDSHSGSPYSQLRGGTHGVANVLLQEGSWAWYTGQGDVKQQSIELKSGYVPERNHTVVMREASDAASATEYALSRSSFFNATSGHANLRYEWCHLIAHGMRGPDTPNNIVAATAFQNTEQLILECVLYGYRTEGLSIDVQAKLAHGWDHLAESIWYRVILDKKTIYSRTMDARRATRPDFKEFGSVAREMRRCINTSLENAFPADDMNMDQWEIIQTLSPNEPDQSAGLWSVLSAKLGLD
ncbi:hypothetical protein [Paraburkholderia bannensis]|uniref:hypothetical protein n=1 Tax=Paraburkholderia bannensis TaxID=765414 RepID=UPI002AB78CE2|nr:hypothetical protein [Paraburkholderia bannensis]